MLPDRERRVPVCERGDNVTSDKLVELAERAEHVSSLRGVLAQRLDPDVERLGQPRLGQVLVAQLRVTAQDEERRRERQRVRVELADERVDLGGTLAERQRVSAGEPVQEQQRLRHLVAEPPQQGRRVGGARYPRRARLAGRCRHALCGRRCIDRVRHHDLVRGPEEVGPERRRHRGLGVNGSAVNTVHDEAADPGVPRRAELTQQARRGLGQDPGDPTALLECGYGQREQLRKLDVKPDHQPGGEESQRDLVVVQRRAVAAHPHVACRRESGTAPDYEHRRSACGRYEPQYGHTAQRMWAARSRETRETWSK